MAEKIYPPDHKVWKDLETMLDAIEPDEPQGLEELRERIARKREWIASCEMELAEERKDLQGWLDELEQHQTGGRADGR